MMVMYSCNVEGTRRVSGRIGRVEVQSGVLREKAFWVPSGLRTLNCCHFSHQSQVTDWQAAAQMSVLRMARLTASEPKQKESYAKFLECYDKLAQTWWHKSDRMYFLTVLCRQEACNQHVCRTMLPSQAPREDFSLFLPSSGVHWFMAPSLSFLPPSPHNLLLLCVSVCATLLLSLRKTPVNRVNQG